MSDVEQLPPCRVCDAPTGDPHLPMDDDCLLPHSYGSRRHPPRRQSGILCCGWCVDRQRAWLREILDLYATLPFVLDPGSVPDETAEHKRPKKAPEAPAPVRLDVLAMISDRARLRRTGEQSDLPDVPAVLSDFAQRLFDDLYPAGATAPDTASGAAAVLIASAWRLAGLPWLDEYDAELRWMRSRLRLVHGLSEGHRPPVGHCPVMDGDGNKCGGPLWLDRDGLMRVECGKCGVEFPEPLLRHLGGMLSA